MQNDASFVNSLAFFYLRLLYSVRLAIPPKSKAEVKGFCIVCFRRFGIIGQQLYCKRCHAMEFTTPE